MVRQLHGRDFAQPPAWVRKFILASLAVVQITPICVGGFVLSTAGSPAIGRVLFAATLICAGAGALLPVYQDWRYGIPFSRSSFFLASILLVGAAGLVHFLSR
jgi:hypothetical protein